MSEIVSEIISSICVDIAIITSLFSKALEFCKNCDAENLRSHRRDLTVQSLWAFLCDPPAGGGAGEVTKEAKEKMN